MDCYRLHEVELGLSSITNNCYQIIKLKFMRLSYKYIWGTVFISNLKFDISSVYKYQKNLGRKLFKGYFFMISEIVRIFYECSEKCMSVLMIDVYKNY